MLLYDIYKQHAYNYPSQPSTNNTGLLLPLEDTGTQDSRECQWNKVCNRMRSISDELNYTSCKKSPQKYFRLLISVPLILIISYPKIIKIYNNKKIKINTITDKTRFLLICKLKANVTFDYEE